MNPGNRSGSGFKLSRPGSEPNWNWFEDFGTSPGLGSTEFRYGPSGFEPGLNPKPGSQCFCSALIKIFYFKRGYKTLGHKGNQPAR